MIVIINFHLIFRTPQTSENTKCEVIRNTSNDCMDKNKRNICLWYLNFTKF